MPQHVKHGGGGHARKTLRDPAFGGQGEQLVPIGRHAVEQIRTGSRNHACGVQWQTPHLAAEDIAVVGRTDAVFPAVGEHLGREMIVERQKEPLLRGDARQGMIEADEIEVPCQHIKRAFAKLRGGMRHDLDAHPGVAIGENLCGRSKRSDAPHMIPVGCSELNHGLVFH